MTALQALRNTGEASAADLAEATGIALEYVYQELVEAEARGLVAIRRYGRHQRRARFTWVAL